MAGPEYSLGGFSGQLSADELARAYAAAGGAPQDLAPEPPPPDLSVQRAPGNYSQEMAAYTAGDLADQNAKIVNAGERGQIASQVASQAAASRREQAELQRGYNDQAKADAASDRERSKKKQEDADALLEEIRSSTTPPSKSAGEKVWGILGGLLAMGSDGRAAAGVQLISQLAGSDRKERWAAEQQANTNAYNAIVRGIDLDNSTEQQRAEVARRMGAADLMYYDSVIEANKQEGMSKDALKVAEDVQLELRQKARGLLREDAGRRKSEADAAAKARASGAKSAREKYFWDLPYEQLAAMPSNVLSEDGQKVLAARTRDEAGRTALGKARQEAGGDVQPGMPTPSGRVVENAAAYAQLSPADRSKLAASDTAARELNSAIDQLLKLRKEHPFAVGLGGFGVGTEAFNKAQLINKQIQLAMKDANTLGTLDRGSQEFLDSMTGNPNSLFDTPEDKLSEIKLLNMRGAEQRAKAAGLSAPNLESQGVQKGVAGGLAPAGGGPLSGAAPIEMIRPDGKRFKVHPTQAQALRGQGWSDAPVAGGAFVMKPSSGDPSQFTQAPAAEPNDPLFYAQAAAEDPSQFGGGM